MRFDTFVKYTGEKPKVKDPVLIEGLPGFGQVGRLVAEHLVRELKGKEFAEIYSSHFPPQVVIKENGLIDMITNNFYHMKLKNGKDVIIVVGEAQAATITGQYEICDKIVEVAEGLGVKSIITVGGYATGKLLKEPRVYGAATDLSMIKEFSKYGVVFESKKDEPRGGIVGASGLLLGIGQLHGMKAVCLMGETPGHPLLIDAKAAEAVIGVLSKHLKVDIPLGDLDARAKDLEKFRLGLEKMMRKMVRKEGEETEKTEAEEEERTKYIG